MSATSNGAGRDELVVTLQRAANLKSCDKIKKQDPYCKLRCGRQETRSATVRWGGRNPVWNESFTFYVGPKLEEVHVEIWDQDTFTPDDLIGTARIPLSQVRAEGRAAVQVPVFTKKQAQFSTLYVGLILRSPVDNLPKVPDQGAYFLEGDSAQASPHPYPAEESPLLAPSLPRSTISDSFNNCEPTAAPVAADYQASQCSRDTAFSSFHVPEIHDCLSLESSDSLSGRQASLAGGHHDDLQELLSLLAQRDDVHTMLSSYNVEQYKGHPDVMKKQWYRELEHKYNMYSQRIAELDQKIRMVRFKLGSQSAPALHGPSKPATPERDTMASMKRSMSEAPRVHQQPQVRGTTDATGAPLTCMSPVGHPPPNLQPAPPPINTTPEHHAESPAKISPHNKPVPRDNTVLCDVHNFQNMQNVQGARYEHSLSVKPGNLQLPSNTGQSPSHLSPLMSPKSPSSPFQVYANRIRFEAHLLALRRWKKLRTFVWVKFVYARKLRSARVYSDIHDIALLMLPPPPPPPEIQMSTKTGQGPGTKAEEVMAQHAARVEADVQQFGQLVSRMAAKVDTIQLTSMNELCTFVDSVAIAFSMMLDVPAVLKHFPDWPEQRFNAMQEAADLYRGKLGRLIRDMTDWLAPSSPLKAMEQSKAMVTDAYTYTNSFALQQRAVEKRFQDHGLPWDRKIWSQVNMAALKLCAQQLRITLQAVSEPTKLSHQKCLELLCDTLDMQYKVYRMAGGYNREVQQLSLEAVHDWEELMALSILAGVTQPHISTF